MIKGYDKARHHAADNTNITRRFRFQIKQIIPQNKGCMVNHYIKFHSVSKLQSFKPKIKRKKIA